MKRKTSILKESNIKTFNTCFDNIDLNLASLKDQNLKNGPEFSFFYEYAHDRSILSLSLDESGTYMATASTDHSIRVHNIKNLSTIKELYHKKCGHYDWVNQVFFTKKNEILSGGLDGKICLWNTIYLCKIPKVNKIMNSSEYLEQQKKVEEVKFKASNNAIICKEMYAHHSTISDMKFDKKNEKCITSSYDKTLKLFDIKKFREMSIYKGSHFYPITKFLWLQNKIISGDKNGTICVFDVESCQEIFNAKCTHNGNIGAMNYFYLYKNGDENFIKNSILNREKERNLNLQGNHYNEKNNSKKDSDKPIIQNNINTINSDYLFGEENCYLNLNNEKIPLIVTGGQNDGTIKVRDFRIFHKYISCKKIHTASINCIITYNLNYKTYIISCSADGFCYQFEIQSICSSNLNNYLKKICVNEPILSAKYIGNHLVLIGSSFGNLFLLDFSDCSNNKLTDQQKNLTGKNDINQNIKNFVEKPNILYDKINRDILWAFGTCKKGGINCIECIFIYDSKNLYTNELEIYSIIAAGDDGVPSFLFMPNSFT
ncbi:WD domain, G-beta repeat-containing protein, putative [Plasmodium gallinaceum]|uniref:WD domain, G-beta repeat-containing protein, putative n=1 Tax=Plasmodium gallinaceum TaxID=5849 RepID=A0A1J1GVJ1_PLAGA|nr:WD domain, G-beta repeat-containing protein, putative [Plasmodium gallinaceum]CRG96262.1 WD domain, G-beta repeat-containing protein, putative [Plasmodium gallinaceum]